MFLTISGVHGNIPIIYALNFARDDHSTPHFEILKLLVEVGAYIDTTKTEQLCAFLATCRSRAPQNIHARTMVEMVLPTGFNNDEGIGERRAMFTPNIVKYLLRQNVLLPSTCIGTTNNVWKFLTVISIARFCHQSGLHRYTTGCSTT